MTDNNITATTTGKKNVTQESTILKIDDPIVIKAKKRWRKLKGKDATYKEMGITAMKLFLEHNKL